jgi:hypothetical protein
LERTHSGIRLFPEASSQAIYSFDNIGKKTRLFLADKTNPGSKSSNFCGLQKLPEEGEAPQIFWRSGKRQKMTIKRERWKGYSMFGTRKRRHG